MLGRPALLRLAALLLLAAFAVHELRYRLVPGGDDAATSGGHGHGALGVVAPSLGLVAGLALAHLLLRAAASPARVPTSVRVARIAPLAAASVLGIFTAQELVEGLVSHHHSGLTDVYGGTGWVAVPLAMLGGLLVSLGVRITQRLEDGAPIGPGGLALRVVVHWPTPRRSITAFAAPLVHGVPLARCAAGRAPPTSR